MSPPGDGTTFTWLKRKFDFSHVKVVPSPGGDITSFLHDEKVAQQCYLTSEPITARRKGASVKAFAISEIGYNPYTTVLAVSGESLRKNPDAAKAMVAAGREGWRSYLDEPKTVNQQMNQVNATIDLEKFAGVAGVPKTFILADASRRNR